MGSLVAGVPTRIRRELTEEERAGVTFNGEGYRLLADAHRKIEPVERRTA